MPYNPRTKVVSVNATIGSVAKDMALPEDATDTISSIRWSPVSNHLAAASWDGKVRIYDVAKHGGAQAVATMTAEAPLFSCDWSKVSLDI
jgi:mRNA export factor